MRPIVLLDCDGVVANFVDAYLRHVGANEGRRFTHDDVGSWDIPAVLRLSHAEAAAAEYGCRAHGHAYSLPVYPGAIEGVRAVREVADVYWLTTPYPGAPTWTHDREAWIARHFGDGPDRIIHTAAKRLVRGDVFVDDNVDNVKAWGRDNYLGRAVLWARPWNAGELPGIRSDSWAEVVSLARGGAQETGRVGG